MIRREVGIVDFGIGNHASVLRVVQSLGHRSYVSDSPERLAGAEVLLLPGVGAFPPAMAALESRGLVDVIGGHARKGKPVIGICLGMQLLTDGSDEVRETAGLGLIPGKVSELHSYRRHIGWNVIVAGQPDELFSPSVGEPFFFNHSFAYDGPAECKVCVTADDPPVTAAVRLDNVVGLQFHPEKSQSAGRQLLARLIKGLCKANS